MHRRRCPKALIYQYSPVCLLVLSLCGWAVIVDWGQADSPSQRVLTLNNGLIAHYEFEDGNELGRDSSGYGYDGDKIGSVSQITKDGKKGRSASFEGKGRIEVSKFKKFSWGPEFSVSVWFQRRGGWENYQGIVNNGYYKSGSWEIRMGREKEARMIGSNITTESDLLKKDDGMWDYIDLGVSINQWHHVVITYDSFNYMLYLNGRKQGSGQKINSQIVVHNTPLTIGQAGSGIPEGQDQEYFYGYIDEVRIYKRSLSETEVKALYDF